MDSSVKTVVFPIAGLGTRILPATNAFPKELLPIVDRPVIQCGVEEAVNSGINQIVLVTNPDNTMTPSYFEPNERLEALLAKRGKELDLKKVRALASMADITTVHQAEPAGLGHAVLMAKTAVGNGAFAVALPDDVIDANPPALRQMIQVFNEVKNPIILVERVPHEAIGRYGIIDAAPLGNGVFEVKDLVEKPHPNRAPSNLAIIGRYILTQEVFEALEQTNQDAGGELQLTDSLRLLLQRRPLYACELSGVRHDVGTKLGYIKALIYFALAQPDFEPDLRDYLESLR